MKVPAGEHWLGELPQVSHMPAQQSRSKEKQSTWTPGKEDPATFRVFPAPSPNKASWSSYHLAMEKHPTIRATKSGFEAEKQQIGNGHRYEKLLFQLKSLCSSKFGKHYLTYHPHNSVLAALSILWEGTPLNSAQCSISKTPLQHRTLLLLNINTLQNTRREAPPSIVWWDWHANNQNRREAPALESSLCAFPESQRAVCCLRNSSGTECTQMKSSG